MEGWDSTYKTNQGNIGLGAAIAFYTKRCIPVCIPLNDSQKYDLVIADGGLKRVSIKTTQYKQNGVYQVLLRNSTLGANSNTIRKFDSSTCDILFIFTKDEDCYIIPSSEITTKYSLTLSSKWDKYKIKY